MPETGCLTLLRNKMFYFETINNKKILKSDYLRRALHLFATRESVVTPKNISSLKEICKNNLEEIAKYLNIKKENIISPVQTHSSNIQIAKKGQTYPDTDALIVEDTDVAIMLNFADCTPVILYDEINNVGAVIHAGWRGTASQIVPKTIRYMLHRYSTNTKDLVAIIGPAISINNYEVDKNVFDKITKTLNFAYTDYFIQDSINGKYKIDLKTVNYHQLEELGVLRIDKCEYCTYDSIDVFFSYRREKGETARHSALLKLN